MVREMVDAKAALKVFQKLQYWVEERPILEAFEMRLLVKSFN